MLQAGLRFWYALHRVIDLQQCFLELSASITINRGCCPIIGPVKGIPMISPVDHLVEITINTIRLKYSFKIHTGSIVKTCDKNVSYLCAWIGDRTHHSGFHRPNGFIFSVMGDVRRRVEQIIDTVAGVATNCCAASSSSNRLSAAKRIT